MPAVLLVIFCTWYFADGQYSLTQQNQYWCPIRRPFFVSIIEQSMISLALKLRSTAFLVSGVLYWLYPLQVIVLCCKLILLTNSIFINSTWLLSSHSRLAMFHSTVTGIELLVRFCVWQVVSQHPCQSNRCCLHLCILPCWVLFLLCGPASLGFPPLHELGEFSIAEIPNTGLSPLPRGTVAELTVAIEPATGPLPCPR